MTETVLSTKRGGTGANTPAGARVNLSLDQVDNTSDANKPVSNATQTALALKANLETGGYGVALNTDYYVGAPSSTKSNFRAGYLALDSYASGDYMIAVGEAALQDAVNNSTCTALGAYALQHCIGTRNTAIGPFAARNITTGEQNIVIGSFSAESIITGSSNVVIGDGLDCPNTSGNIRIGTFGVSRASFNGIEWDFAQRFKEIKFATNYVSPSTDNAITFFQRPTLGSVLGYTPTVYGGTAAGTATYSQREAYVWAINNVFHFKIRLVWSGHTGTGSLNVTLPLTSITEQTTGVVYSNLLPGVGTSMVNQMFIAKNTNFIQFFGELVGGGTGATTTISAAGQLAIDGSIIY